MGRHALIVGIDRYDHLSSPLRLPSVDAEAIAQVLEDLGQFKVDRLPEVLVDGRPSVGANTAVTRDDLCDAIVRLFLPEGGPAPDTALLFVAGHGLQTTFGVPEGFLAASDTRADATGGISLSWLRDVLRKSAGRADGVRNQIVWLDTYTCHLVQNSGEVIELTWVPFVPPAAEVQLGRNPYKAIDKKSHTRSRRIIVRLQGATTGA